MHLLPFALLAIREFIIIPRVDIKLFLLVTNNILRHNLISRNVRHFVISRWNWNSSDKSYFKQSKDTSPHNHTTMSLEVVFQNTLPCNSPAHLLPFVRLIGYDGW